MQIMQLRAERLHTALLSLRFICGSGITDATQRYILCIFLASKLLQSLHVPVLSSMHYCRAAGQALTELFTQLQYKTSSMADSKGTLPRQGYLPTRNAKEGELLAEILFILHFYCCFC